LGKYEVIARLGKGGMAQVHLAVSRGPGGFNKLVVLKRLESHDDGFRQMFLDEAQLAARCIIRTSSTLRGVGDRRLLLHRHGVPGGAAARQADP